MDNEGECKVGYWRAEVDASAQFLRSGPVTIARPFGKFAHYNKDGTFKTKEGVYAGTDKQWNLLILEYRSVDYLCNFNVEEVRKQIL